LEDPGGTEVPPQAEARATKLPWAVAAALGLALVALGVWLWRATRPVERPLVRLDVDLGSEIALLPLGIGSHNVILSPDGTRLVYVSGDPPRLYTRRLDQSKANELPGTEEAIRPFFSPDGQWVGFFNDRNGNKLSKISVEGGAVVLLADLSGTIGGSWGADDNIIVGGVLKGLLRVPASGGAPTTILERASGAGEYVFPQVLPGGKAVLFSDRTRDANANSIEVFSFADRRNKTLVRGGYSGRYLPSGHLVYANKGTLFAIPFDVDKLETRGTAVPVLDDLAYEPGNSGVDLDFAGTGALVYRRGTAAAGIAAMATIQWVDAAGKRDPLRAKPGAYRSLRISPDGKRLLLLAAGGGRDVWVYDPQRDAMTKLPFGAGAVDSPIWSADGRYVFFTAPGKGIYWTRADGAGQPQPLTESKVSQMPSSFAPDGKRLVYFEILEKPQMWTLPLEEQGGQWKAGKPEQFLRSQFADFNPAFSPDGHWLAYVTSESPRNTEVYVRAFPPPASGQGGQWQISNSGGTAPRWSRNGRELIYQSGDQLMIVSYSVKGDTFLPEKPRVWIEKVGASGFARAWDLAPDGKRAVVLTPVGTSEGPKSDHEVTFLLNFFDELRRRAPVGSK